ncbi:MAG: 30S ribosomal protein S16 [Candidatus Cloacimonetes bacterium]|nr:30S ribosomal protein S16 [Candidatus Cloacimonadota bacterium]
MVKLRLKRMGTIDKPFYRIVAVDSRKKRDGIYLEALGYYDPKTDPLTLKIDFDKALTWLGKGAQPSETVNSLFRKAGILEKWHQIKIGSPQEKTADTETTVVTELPDENKNEEIETPVNETEPVEPVSAENETEVEMEEPATAAAKSE